MGFKEDDEYVARVVEAKRNRKKESIAEFSCNGESSMKRHGKFRLDKVTGFEVLEDRIYIYLNGGYVVSDRDSLLEGKLNNLHLWIEIAQ